MIIVETLGTMLESPMVSEFAKPLYKYMEEEQGLKRIEIRTDYKFEDLEQAIDLTTFFFGEEIGRKVEEKNLTIVPECTGIWHT